MYISYNRENNYFLIIFTLIKNNEYLNNESER